LVATSEGKWLSDKVMSSLDGGEALVYVVVFVVDEIFVLFKVVFFSFKELIKFN
jgi:hypothetical protein